MQELNEPKSRSELVKAYVTSSAFIKPFLGVVIGGIAGFLYYRFVGCSSGTCAITSNPYISTLFGAFFGFYLVNSPCARNKC